MSSYLAGLLATLMAATPRGPTVMAVTQAAMPPKGPMVNAMIQLFAREATQMKLIVPRHSLRREGGQRGPVHH
jgi:hypothetical protein